MTLFQSSAQRLTSSKLLEFAPLITVTNSGFRFIIGEQLQEIGIDPGQILIEPEAKNETAVLLVTPLDHVIPDLEDPHVIIKVGLSHVQNQKMVTFGIKQMHPDISYGYLDLSTDPIDNYGTFFLKKFVEKANLQDAEQVLEAGHYLYFDDDALDDVVDDSVADDGPNFRRF